MGIFFEARPLPMDHSCVVCPADLIPQPAGETFGGKALADIP